METRLFSLDSRDGMRWRPGGGGDCESQKELLWIRVFWVLGIIGSPGSGYVGIARGASGGVGSGYVGICRPVSGPRDTPDTPTRVHAPPSRRM